MTICFGVDEVGFSWLRLSRHDSELSSNSFVASKDIAVTICF